jgi:short subunit dehydrogenase
MSDSTPSYFKSVADELPVQRAKTAIVTGGSSGIGLEMVKKLIEKGYRVVANSRNIASVMTLHNTAEKTMPKLPAEFKPKPTPNSAAPSGAKFEYHPGGGIHSNKIPSSQAMGGPTSRSILKKTKLKAERIAERRRHRARDIELAGMAHSRPVVRPDTSTTTYLTREQTQAESTAVSPQKIWSQRDRQQRKPAIPTWLRSTKKRLKNVWKKNQESNHRN